MRKGGPPIWAQTGDIIVLEPLPQADDVVVLEIAADIDLDILLGTQVDEILLASLQGVTIARWTPRHVLAEPRRAITEPTQPLLRSQLYRALWTHSTNALVGLFKVHRHRLNQACAVFNIPMRPPGASMLAATGDRIVLPPLPPSEDVNVLDIPADIDLAEILGPDPDNALLLSLQGLSPSPRGSIQLVVEVQKEVEPILAAAEHKWMTRSQLYRALWIHPAAQLAKMLRIERSSLDQACATYAIPTRKWRPRVSPQTIEKIMLMPLPAAEDVGVLLIDTEIDLERIVGPEPKGVFLASLNGIAWAPKVRGRMSHKARQNLEQTQPVLRSHLYRALWRHSAKAVANLLGIPEGTMGYLCKRFDIPTRKSGPTTFDKDQDAIILAPLPPGADEEIYRISIDIDLDAVIGPAPQGTALKHLQGIGAPMAVVDPSTGHLVDVLGSLGFGPDAAEIVRIWFDHSIIAQAYDLRDIATGLRLLGWIEADWQFIKVSIARDERKSGLMRRFAGMGLTFEVSAHVAEAIYALMQFLITAEVDIDHALPKGLPLPPKTNVDADGHGPQARREQDREPQGVDAVGSVVSNALGSHARADAAAAAGMALPQPLRIVAPALRAQHAEPPRPSDERPAPSFAPIEVQRPIQPAPARSREPEPSPTTQAKVEPARAPKRRKPKQTRDGAPDGDKDWIARIATAMAKSLKGVPEPDWLRLRDLSLFQLMQANDLSLKSALALRDDDILLVEGRARVLGFRSTALIEIRISAIAIDSLRRYGARRNPSRDGSFFINVEGTGLSRQAVNKIKRKWLGGDNTD